MDEEPDFCQPQIDTRKIEPVFLDHQPLDVGELLLTGRIDVARKRVDLVGQMFERTLRAYEMSDEIALLLEEAAQVRVIEVRYPGVVRRRRQRHRGTDRSAAGYGGMEIPCEFGATGGNAIVRETLVDPALGL